MTEPHDVLADPLTPYWRAKVEAAARVRVTDYRQRALPRLTDLERQTLDLHGSGFTARHIANRRGVTPQAVHGTLTRALDKVERGAQR